MGTGRELEVAGHLTLGELFERYRGADDPTVKAHYRALSTVVDCGCAAVANLQAMARAA